MLSPYAIGLLSTLPSKYFYLYTLIGCVLCGRSLFLSRIDYNVIGKIIYFNLVFCISLMIGLAGGDSEAKSFLLRAVSCFSTILVLNVIHFRFNGLILNNVFRGVYHGALLNSLCVIVFALFPEYYEQIGLADFSGYDKGVRYLRSPGLQTGMDTAGYLATIGFICGYCVRQTGRKVIGLFGTVQFVLLLAPVFTSRSAMIVQLIVLTVYSVSIGRRDRVLSRIVIWSLICFYLYISSVFVLSMYTSDVNMGRLGEWVGDVDMVDTYSFNRSEYESHYDIIDLMKITPVGGSERYDNTVARLLACAGVIPLAVLIPMMVYFVSVLRPSRVGVVVSWQVLGLILIVYVFANLKNTYIFYPTFQVIIFSFVFTVNSRRLKNVSYASGSFFGGKHLLGPVAGNQVLTKRG